MVDYMVDPLASLLVPAAMMPGGASELIAHATVAESPTWPWTAATVLVGYSAIAALAILGR